MKINIGEWNIDLTPDEDGHLTIGINNNDKSKVIEVDEDLSTNDSEWVGRFTTDQIENQHLTL